MAQGKILLDAKMLSMSRNKIRMKLYLKLIKTFLGKNYGN
jgi:ribose 5-phosphate isomerase RpiB